VLRQHVEGGKFRFATKNLFFELLDISLEQAKKKKNPEGLRRTKKKKSERRGETKKRFMLHPSFVIRAKTHSLPQFLLSNAFEPLPSPLCPSSRRRASSACAAAATRFAPSASDIEQFRLNGYFTTPPILPRPTLRLLTSAAENVFEGYIDTNNPPYEYSYWRKAVGKYNLPSRGVNREVLKINNGWWVNATLRRFLLSGSFSRSIGATAADLLGVDRVALWHDQVIIKPPAGKSGDSGVIGWHQDYAYWQISDNPNGMVTALVMLQRTTRRNGCLLTAVGSHRGGLVELGDHDPGFFTKDLNGTAKALRLSSCGDIIHNEVEAGQVTFHHSLTFHGSGPNDSDTNRWAIAYHMFAPDIVGLDVTKHHHNRRDLGPNQRPGMRFEGPAFPILFDRRRRPAAKRSATA
jgi:ectoine hydroxylase-related dioxygenase (phytanoyl-CoA dioxygenase family)